MSGRPISLLREPGVHTVGALRWSTWAIRSLVLVLPAEPVSATRVGAEPLDDVRGRGRPSAVCTSSTTIAGTPTGRAASTAAAPAATARSAKSWPSTRSPAKATKRLPGSTSRESLTTGPVTCDGRIRYVVRLPADDCCDLGEGEGDHKFIPAALSG